ncbi:hypothetical protein BELL_0596g00080 [Botrytis elliptica]|uniref:SAP domain-containing protein n=1 Tax=Botrytis elliptica TaxID=278938 RepID=A0A4Z1JCG8_9HELO|nr:hypothetical protein EAE99_008673 [Botrytis elliptica]TGO71296.1 hypothetical protein BELL_0596g00080 [Botrytis elliptica]
MPPTKRPLAQADTNVILPPKKKHKEKNVTLSDDHASKSKGELVEMLKDRSMPINGTKDVLIQRLRDNDGHVALMDSGKAERRKSARIDAAEQSAKINERREEGLKDLWTVKNKALTSPSAPIAEKASAKSSRNAAAVPSQSSHGHRINYRTKDNSKLRALLRDWRVMQPEEVESMDRMAMIERLERHEMRGYGDDYESLTCDQLSTLLSARMLPCSGVTKAARIERLRYDDALDRDNGNLEEYSLYTHLVICQNEILRYEQLMNWVEGEEGEKLYQDLEVAGLKSLMDLRQQGRKIKVVCEDSELIGWLQADDQKLARKKKVEISTLMGCEVPAELERWEKKLADTRMDLESRIGHSLPAEVPMYESSKYDVPVVTKKTGDRGGLDYDPKKTNWGLFSAWELCRIAKKKGAPGYGTKDAMIKWLETGILEYEDMHLESLREQCWRRLVPQYSNDDKAALIERLKLLDKYIKDSEESSARETSEPTGAENDEESSVEQADEIVPVAEPSTIGTVSSDSPYAKKDNSMLRVLLRDRHLQISGTREEMIHRLETSPYNYESYTSEELSLILKDRHLTNASHGSKESKIERLKNSDEAFYDSANFEDTQLYVQLNLGERFIKDKEQALKALSDPNISYEKLDSSALRELASALGLSPHSGAKTVIKQLHANDQKSTLEGKGNTAMRDAIDELTASLKTRKEEYNKAKEELEKSIGHPVLDIAIVMGRYNAILRRDHEIVDNYQPIRKPGPVCDYDWKDSHWAGKTERELRDMCRRQGMEGWGTKATHIKWLETGSVEYEDLSVTSLEIMCRKRGIKFKSGTKRLDLAMKLRETDEKETAYRESGIMALKKMCKERGMKTTRGETKQDLITKLRVADENTGRA